MLRDQLGDEVLAAMDELSMEFREVLELHYLQGRSYRDISRIISCPMGTVMSRLHRARRFLRSRLESYAAGLGIQTSPQPLAA